MSLAEAREEARNPRSEARSGRDPDLLGKRNRPSFDVAARCRHASLSRIQKSVRRAELWLRSLELYAFPKIGKRPIRPTTSADALAILNPIWADRHVTGAPGETAHRRGLRLAEGGGANPCENPVAGLKKALPAVMARLAARAAAPVRCLEFLILTAPRSGEVRGAQWSEFDLEAAVRPVPDARMQRGLPHRLPLSAEAQSGDALPAPQSGKDDPDLLLDRALLAGLPLDAPDQLVSGILRCSGSLFHLRSLAASTKRKFSVAQTPKSARRALTSESARVSRRTVRPDCADARHRCPAAAVRRVAGSGG